jgi:alpha-glucosidase
MWWRDALVYQIYPRSFQDSNGDGVGDLPGIAARLDHLVDLGVDALWLSPIYPSPMADFGYDVSDFTGVDPVFGTLEDFDALLAAVHGHGLRLLMDLVPCHTSIEHSWFAEHPDWYVWADEPNNWVAAFGGSAWTWHEGRGRYYLHSFYPEQADLDWRNPEVVEAMQGVVRYWLDRGVDGFRLDAIDRLLKDPALRDDPPVAEPHALPMSEGEMALALTNSRNAPDIGDALGAIRSAAGDALLVGEVYLPNIHWEPYLEHLDAVFAFQLFHTPWDSRLLRQVIEAESASGGAAWVLSNHDFGRLSTRFGPQNERAAAELLLTLPGLAFLYQGDEIGLGEGPGAEPPRDRAGRDRFRHPMQWDGSPNAGFTDGEPWLPLVDPAERNVLDQAGDPDSMLSYVKHLVRERRELGSGFRLLDAPEGTLAYERGGRRFEIEARVKGLGSGGKPSGGGE